LNVGSLNCIVDDVPALLHLHSLWRVGFVGGGRHIRLCGCLVSPQFVSSLFARDAADSLVRYAAAVGMIWGIFLGTAVMGFCLLLVTIVQVARIIRKKADTHDLQ
jgi:hypothetical protein